MGPISPIKKSTEYFLQSCSKPIAGSVDRKDMLNFKIFLKGKGFSKRYVYSNFERDDLSQMGESRARSLERRLDPEEYTNEEIETLLDYANDEERLVLSSFLCSGFRSGELANFTYADINFATNIWRVEMKEMMKAQNGMPRHKPPIAM